MSLLLLAAGFAAGLLARRLNLNSAHAPDWINAVIIHIALPAMILLRVPSLTLDASALIPVLLAWTVILTTAGIILLLARRLGWPRETTGALLLVVPLSNSAYLGLPLIHALADHATVTYAILYDQLGNFMALAIYASIVIALLGRADRPPTVGSVVKRVVLFPPFLVTLIALCITPEALPAWSITPLTFFSAVMGPLAMVIVGLQLELKVPTELRQPLFVGTAIKLLGAPLLVIIGATVAGVGGPATHATVLQAAMPSMITAGLLGIAAGFSRALIVAMIGFTTLASVLTLPGLFWYVLD